MDIYGLQYLMDVTIIEIIWQKDKALEILRIEIKSMIALHNNKF